jgi:hypothetical protein
VAEQTTDGNAGMRRFPMEKPVNRIVECDQSAINQTQNGERGREFGD